MAAEIALSLSLCMHVGAYDSQREPDKAVGPTERLSVPVLTACASVWHDNVLKTHCDSYHLYNGASERLLLVSEPVMSLVISQCLIHVQASPSASLYSLHFQSVLFSHLFALNL